MGGEMITILGVDVDFAAGPLGNFSREGAAQMIEALRTW